VQQTPCGCWWGIPGVGRLARGARAGCGRPAHAGIGGESASHRTVSGMGGEFLLASLAALAALGKGPTGTVSAMMGPLTPAANARALRRRRTGACARGRWARVLLHRRMPRWLGRGPVSTRIVSTRISRAARIRRGRRRAAYAPSTLLSKAASRLGSGPSLSRGYKGLRAPRPPRLGAPRPARARGRALVVRYGRPRARARPPSLTRSLRGRCPRGRILVQRLGIRLGRWRACRPILANSERLIGYLAGCPSSKRTYRPRSSSSNGLVGFAGADWANSLTP
jgi:hypothetical protein